MPAWSKHKRLYALSFKPGGQGLGYVSPFMLGGLSGRRDRSVGSRIKGPGYIPNHIDLLVSWKLQPFIHHQSPIPSLLDLKRSYHWWSANSGGPEEGMGRYLTL